MMSERIFLKWNCVTLCFICGIFLNLKDTTAQLVQVYPSPRAEAFLGANFRLTCSNNKTGIAVNTVWRLDANTKGTVLLSASSCTPYGHIANETLYDIQCVGQEAVHLTVKNVKLQQHGDVWSCYQLINSQPYPSNNTTIFVKVRVSSVTLSTPSSSSIIVSEYATTDFSCTTSRSRPAPTISWYTDEGTKLASDDTLISQTVSQSPTAGSEGYVSTTGSLTYKPSRSANGKYLFCQSKDDAGHTVTSDRKILLNVTYKPDSGPFIHSYNNSRVYKAIANKQQILTCSVIGGNPLASISWSCFTGSEADLSSGRNVSKRWTWTTSRDGTCKCISTHLGESKEVVLSVNILSPPTPPVFQLHSQTIQGSTTVKIMHDNSAPITCSATSYPSPDKYTWKYNGQSKVSQVASLNPSQITADGQYSCHVRNTMPPTQGQVEYGNNSAYINVQRLYAPSVAPFSIDPVMEGGTLSVQCKTVPGNPASTTYSWKRKLSSTLRNTWQDIPGSTLSADHLLKQNINRTDAGTYRCTASNVMKPTAEFQQIGSSWQTFILNVLYKTSVSRFFEVNHSNSSEVTVSENSSISLQCEVDSNPGSTIDILKNGEIVMTKENTKQFTYSNSKVSCDTAGIYSCVGYNDHNIEVNKPNQDLRLFVTCSPRLKTPEDFQSNIKSSLNKEVRLSIVIVGYPVPRDSEYVWQKRKGKTWEILTNDDTTEIKTKGLESSLIILSVKESDFQQYRVVVRNNIGKFSQEFFLNPQSYKPKPPKNVLTVDGSLTESSVIIRWNPDYDGGIKQTFVVRFHEQGEIEWLEVSKKDERTKVMNITLTGLADKTTFVYQMYSKNAEGISAFTEISKFTTIEKECTECRKDKSALIVGIVLGLVIVGVVIYAIYLTVLQKRKHLYHRKEDITEKASGRMYVNLALPTKTEAREASKREKDNTTYTDNSESHYSDLNKELTDQESAYDALSAV